MRYLKDRVRHIAHRIITPSAWVVNGKVNYEYSEKLERLLKDDTVVKTPAGTCTMMVGDLEVWVSNYPYSYGEPWMRGECTSVGTYMQPTMFVKKMLRKKQKRLEDVTKRSVERKVFDKMK